MILARGIRLVESEEKKTRENGWETREQDEGMRHMIKVKTITRIVI